MPSLYGQSSNVVVNSSNTTGLYAITNTGNVVTANVVLSNTPGLYIGSSGVFVPTNARIEYVVCRKTEEYEAGGQFKKVEDYNYYKDFSYKLLDLSLFIVAISISIATLHIFVCA